MNEGKVTELGGVYFLRTSPKGVRRFALMRRIEAYPGDEIVRLCVTRKDALMFLAIIQATHPREADAPACQFQVRESRRAQKLGIREWGDFGWSSVARAWRWRVPPSYYPGDAAAWRKVMIASRGGGYG